MADILDASGDKIGTIGEDNKVRNKMGETIGTVSNNSEVWSQNPYRKVGYVDGDGNVYEGTTHAGTVRSDGYVLDYDGRTVGRISGGHVFSGGAALLLLLR